MSDGPEEAAGDKDARQLRDKLAELKQKFDTRPRHGVLSGDSEKVRSELVECFRANKDKPLKCQEEYEKFKSHVKSLEAAL